MAPREPGIAELSAEADHTARRVALYQQKLYAGRGEARRLQSCNARPRAPRSA